MLTREEWLRRAALVLDEHIFRPVGYDMPAKFRVSCGFPYGRRGGKGQHSIGQCWSHECSADKSNEIFVSPEIDDPLRAADILVHEMIHAIVGIEEGHGKAFRKCALAVGLEGKMTATIASPELAERLKQLLASLPTYPHFALNPAAKGDGPKKQGTRMLKITCPKCGYLVRTSAKWADLGMPTCACGQLMAMEA